MEDIKPAGRAPITMDAALRVLNKTFGYTGFRQSQEAVISRLLTESKSALVIFPTGGGKSLCYQIPGVLLPHLTIVISPLLSLMKDQVDVLTRKGVKAASLDSTLTANQASTVREGVQSGDLKLLYVAPERLNNENFVRMLEGVTVSLLAIDEAHCVAEWGPSFRPEYLKVARFAKEIKAERVLALTATATRPVEKAICEGFDIDESEGVFRTPVYRNNLHISAYVATDLDAKLKILAPKLKARTGPAIIYVTLQKQCDQAMKRLQQMGITQLNTYHAGMKPETRKSVQEWFMKSDKGVVCATIAFAMGIDKNNIRQIHHLMMPKSIENWTQEIGRAGRDGLDSECSLYLSPADVPVLEGFARGDACSKQVLLNWLNEVFAAKPDNEDSVHFNLYRQSKTFDIRPNMLNLLFALLELDYGLLRARTPFYEIYNIKKKSDDGWAKMMADTSNAAVTVRKYWKEKRTQNEINVVEAAESSGMPRNRFAGVISGWDLEGWITSVPSQVRAVFKILKPLEEMPKTPKVIGDLADKLASVMDEREAKELGAITSVIDIATGYDCYALALADHFGDGDSVVGGRCEHCTYCKTGQALEFEANYQPPTKHLIDAVLEACPVRDDSRVLARFAFGITSPRLTELGLSKDPLFGSSVDTDYTVLLQEFEKACQAADGQNVATPASSGTKRKGSVPAWASGAKRGRGR